MSDGRDHAAVLKLIKPPLRRGKDDDWHAGMSEDKQFHVTPEPWGPPFVIFAVHDPVTFLLL
jgi:hypothetical protein